jgi:ketosteroid isomerase-like protein
MNVLSNTSFRVTSFLALAVLLGALAFLASTQRAVSASSPDFRSLEAASQGFADAFAAADPHAIASYFAEDAVAMYPDIANPVPTVGYEANLQAWIGAYTVIDEHPLTSDLVVVAKSRDLGYSYGRWAVRDFPGLGNVAGRWIAIWEWTKQGWKITYLSAHLHEDIDPEEILSK